MSETRHKVPVEECAIRAAKPAEGPALSELALRSKAHWGYPKPFMDACRAELSVGAADIRTLPVFVLECGSRVTGFYGLEPLEPGCVELAWLFVEPDAIGTGCGAMLIAHARKSAARLGYERMLVQGDPHAAGFYLAAGARPAGDKPSASIPGRTLPLFEFLLGG